MATLHQPLWHPSTGPSPSIPSPSPGRWSRPPKLMATLHQPPWHPSTGPSPSIVLCSYMHAVPVARFCGPPLRGGSSSRYVQHMSLATWAAPEIQEGKPALSIGHEVGPQLQLQETHHPLLRQRVPHEVAPKPQNFCARAMLMISCACAFARKTGSRQRLHPCCFQAIVARRQTAETANIFRC